MSLFRRIGDRVFGRGEASVTLAVMDGPLKPNRRLDAAEALLELPGIDNLVIDGTAVWCSAGSTLLRLDAGVATPLQQFDSDIACLAAGPGGRLAIGLDGGGLLLREADGTERTLAADAGIVCPTAALFLDTATLIVASGSAVHPATRWKHDLMTLGRSGSLWRIDLATGLASRIAAGLAFPYGLAAAPDGRILVSESWRHRVLAFDPAGVAKPAVLLGDLPAYPARLAAAAGGGYWLALFAPRSQLIEFVLREDDYRSEMLAEIDPEVWVAPALASVAAIEAPLQAGAVRQMGILKPWAPSRSYGLVVRCDAAMMPLASFHSRADGRRHGVTSLCERGDDLLVGAKGAGLLLRLPRALPAGRAA